MATFQLAGLPSLQVSNQTAGGLGLPAVPQYAERPNTGVMLAQGIGSIYDNLQAREKQQAESDFMKSFGAAYAANDRDAMKKLAATYPDQIEKIQKGMGFIDQDRNQIIGQAAIDLRLASKSGDQSLMASLQKNAPILNQMGLSPEEAFLSFKQDPKQFDQITDLIGMHALGPEKYFDIQDKIEGRDIDRNKLAETERSNRASESLTQRGQNISAQNAALDREIKRAELASKSLDRQAQKETDDLKKQELEQKIAIEKEKSLQKKQELVTNYNNQYDSIIKTQQNISEIKNLQKENPKTFYHSFGLGSTIGRLTDEGRIIESKVKSAMADARLIAIDIMKGSGPVTDADARIGSQALLSIDDNSRPEVIIKAINDFNRVLDRSKRRLDKQKNTIDRYQKDIDEQNKNYLKQSNLNNEQLNNEGTQLSDDELLNKYL